MGVIVHIEAQLRFEYARVGLNLKTLHEERCNNASFGQVYLSAVLLAFPTQTSIWAKSMIMVINNYQLALTQIVDSIFDVKEKVG